MPTTNGISDVVFRDTMNRAVQEVMRTMLDRTAVLDREIDPRQQSRGTLEIMGQHVVGTVGFIGDINGLIYLYIDTEFAALAAVHLLGVSRDELEEAGDEAVNDAIGELTNMTVGTFKNQLCDRGYLCTLTIPSILRGSNFSIQPISAATRRIYDFKVGQHRIITDLLMKIGS